MFSLKICGLAFLEWVDGLINAQVIKTCKESFGDENRGGEQENVIQGLI